MYEKSNRETGEILAALYKKGFNDNPCSICGNSYILATKTSRNLKLTCRKCGNIRSLNIKMIFGNKALSK